MRQAAIKAKSNSDLYNRLDKEIEERELETCRQRKIQKHKIINQRVDEAKADYQPLQKAYKRYIFWRDEQNRCALLLTGELAYEQLMILNK